ncbi:MAG: glycosyltransferase, partial [Planctomycetota bacterium]|nr:glycosyltransferase [Planctomycetota bacterium]
SERYGVDVIEIHNAGDPNKAFADSYSNAEVERIFADLLGELAPQVVHFTHLLWGLSVRLPEIAMGRNITTVATFTDFGLLCHRGQLLDGGLQPCEVADRATGEYGAGAGSGGGALLDTAERCARCIRRPGPWDQSSWARWPRQVAVDALAAIAPKVGGGRVVVAEDLHCRRKEVARALAHIQHAIAPTAALADYFLAAGFPPERLSIMPYGIDESAYGAQRERSWQGVRFGYLGQFMPHKGLDVLFAAVDLMRQRLPESVEPWEVVLYGNTMRGRQRHFLRGHYRRELAARLHFRGPFEPLEAPRIMSELDVIVLPSRWLENAPLTVLQARASGVPVIASDVRGVREVLEPGVHGTLVPVGDAPALAAAMRACVIGRPEWSPARPRPDPVVSYERHLAEMAQLYTATLANGGRGAGAARPEETAPLPQSPLVNPLAGVSCAGDALA